MSTFRKTVLTTAIIGAGLASTSGAAFATEGGHHHDGGHHKSEHSSSAKGCSNTALGQIDNGGSKTLVGILDGSQGALGLNVCDNLNGNTLLSGNNIAGGDIVNGNTTTSSSSIADGKNALSSILG